VKVSNSTVQLSCSLAKRLGILESPSLWVAIVLKAVIIIIKVVAIIIVVIVVKEDVLIIAKLTRFFVTLEVGIVKLFQA
jgi:hypothetical protein